MGNIFSQSDIDFFFQEDDLLLENIHRFRNQVLADNLQRIEENRASGKVWLLEGRTGKNNEILGKKIFYTFQIMMFSYIL